MSSKREQARGQEREPANGPAVRLGWVRHCKRRSDVELINFSLWTRFNCGLFGLVLINCNYTAGVPSDSVANNLVLPALTSNQATGSQLGGLDVL